MPVFSKGILLFFSSFLLLMGSVFTSSFVGGVAAVNAAG